jgi:hypothetical protein
MSRDWEAQFGTWAKAPGKTEQDRMEHAEKAVRDAVDASPKLSVHDVGVFAQGSYKNRTHIPRESDVDIRVVCTDVFHSEWSLVDERAKTDPAILLALRKEAGVSEAAYTFREFKNDVEAALVARFGRASVKRGDKAFDVRENSYRVDADVLAALERRRWRRNAKGELTWTSGTWFKSDSGVEIHNYPEQQYLNGVAKHERTGKRFKKLVRVLKNLRNEMLDGDVTEAEPIRSFLTESLVWNVPDGEFGHTRLYEDLREVIRYVFLRTRPEDREHEWHEENGIKFLFHSAQPWTRLEVNAFARAAWNYVGYGKG